MNEYRVLGICNKTNKAEKMFLSWKITETYNLLLMIAVTIRLLVSVTNLSSSKLTPRP